MKTSQWELRSIPAAIPALFLTALFALLPNRAPAACIARAPSPSPSSPASSPALEASPAPAASQPPLYSEGDQIYTVDRDGTLYYYFQGNRDGTAKVKKEIRYDRNLWDTCAQLQIRLPFITRYPTAPNTYSPDANPYSGFGNAELRYSYNVTSPTFNHSLQAGAAFPTANNGVESLDTQIKLFYTVKWKWKGGSVAYVNEYDQTVIRPPGASETSYYEGQLSLPEVSFVDSPAVRGLKFSTIYTFRTFFNEGGIYKSALGFTVFGNMNDVALSIVDSWGVGGNGLWKYKFEANAAARF